MTAKEAWGRLRELPLGDPCRPGCTEAGWQSRVLSLLKVKRKWVSCGNTGLQPTGRQASRKGPEEQRAELGNHARLLNPQWYLPAKVS